MDTKNLKERASALTAQLTLEEKIGMIHGAHLFSTKGVERLGIPPLVMSDGPMGVRQEFEPDHWVPINHTDDYVSYLPCNSALASTWNRDLAFEMGSVLGAEARGRGKDVILGPGVNIKRSPLCGRNFEYFSEDPYLTGELAVEFIRGVQQWDVAACVKHFAANNQETQRLWVEVEIDENALRRIYLPAFYSCLTEGGSLSVMGAYNLIYGEHCCQSKFLLEQVLRQEWGYDGLVISDWGAVHDTELAANSQLDIEMSVTDNFDEYFMADPLKKAVEEGKIPESKVDEKVERILLLMLRLHMLEGQERKSGRYNAPEHRQTALNVARESVVLLKNENQLLPLSEKKVKKLLMIGENAERIHSNGGGSAEIKALYEISPLLGVKMVLGGNAKVDFVKGYDSGKKEEASEVNWQEASLQDGGGKRKAAEGSACSLLFREALEKAADPSYDAVIFVGGLNHDYDSEGLDRADMKLPYEQDQLICKLLEIRPDMVVTMVAGSPVEMEKWIDKAQALVWSWYAGMEGGYGLAEALFGRVNPSGKLPETFYKNHMDCSAHCIGEFGTEETVAYREGIFVGYRYNETFDVAPRFCFGHGLSYTEFVYGDATVEQADGISRVSLDVTNAGSCSGAETVQVYRMPLENADKKRPAKELVGFAKVALEPGEKQRVVIGVTGGLEGCCLGIGGSVQDIRCQVFSAEND